MKRLNPILRSKLAKLQEVLRKAESVLVAYSGGVDSSFLLKVALDVLGPEKVLAVTAVSPTYPAEELAAARKLARDLGVRQKLISTSELRNRLFASNPVRRCYWCKKELFRHLVSLAKKSRLEKVVDGSNLEDCLDYRPGEQARKEYGVISPLQIAGLTKKEIRLLARKFSLPVWDKPSSACLASRIPYGTPITLKKLKRIARAEKFLRQSGFRQVRVRDFDLLAKLEVEEKDFLKVIRQREKIVSVLKSCGYLYVTLDLQPYRSGSLNALVRKKLQVVRT